VAEKQKQVHGEQTEASPWRSNRSNIVVEEEKHLYDGEGKTKIFCERDSVK